METVKAREQGTRQYNMVDCAKLLFAICIVGIHTSLLNVDESLGAWLFSSVFFRSAVPFFFAVSGYFLSKKIFLIPKSNKEAVWKVTRRYCIRLLYPLAFWGGGRSNIQCI